MKIAHLLTIALTATLITACGSAKSSSEKGGTTATPMIGIGTGTSGQANNNKANISYANTSTAMTGKQTTIGTNLRASAITTTQSSGDINRLIVNGKTVEIIPEGMSNTQNIDMKDVNYNGNKITRVGSAAALKSARYGYLKDGDNGTPVLFAHGNTSTSIPTAGVFTYTGNAVNVALSKDGKSTTVSTHSATFRADFDTKYLSGQISTIAPIKFVTKINGNQFEGANSGYIASGHFYGDKAGELAGVYRSADGTVSGAFGATKK